MFLSNKTIASRNFGRFLKTSVDYNFEPVDFTLKALNSEYKRGIEIYNGHWFSQSPYYYLDEFLETNKVKIKPYNDEDKTYEKERMYWLGYCLQDWSNRTTLTGKDISKLWGEDGIRQVLDHYKIYHTVDPLVVLEDSIDVNNINLDFEKILINN